MARGRAGGVWATWVIAALVACAPAAGPGAAPAPPTAVPGPTVTVAWTAAPAPPNGEAAAAAGAQ
jgi:hypothetical protein